jgi:hypothetical protein
MTGLEERTLQRALKSLSDMKYIFIEYVNNNSAKRRIYTVLDSPKKLEYLAKRGMFNMSHRPAVAEAKNEKPEVPKPTTPAVAYDRQTSRPKRADYSSDEEYEKAFYEWNKEVVL